jgi:hypothetical protein
MACGDLEEIEIGCTNNLGGGTEFLVNDQASITVTKDAATHKVTAAVHESAFLNIAFKRNAIKVEEEEKINLDEGSNYHEAKVTLSLKRREGEKSAKIKILGEGQRLLAIAFKDGNGLCWYIENAQLSGNVGGFGQNKAEGSKYDLSFMAENEYSMYQMDAAVFAQIKAAPAP